MKAYKLVVSFNNDGHEPILFNILYGPEEPPIDISNIPDGTLYLQYNPGG